MQPVHEVSRYTHVTCDRCGRKRAFYGVPPEMALAVSKTKLMREARAGAGWSFGQRVLCAPCQNAMRASGGAAVSLPRRNPSEFYHKSIGC